MEKSPEIHEFLRPTWDLLEAASHQPGQLHDVQGQLGEVAQATSDASLPQLASFARLLQQLIRIYTPLESESIASEHEVIHQFVREAIGTLSRGLNEEPDAPACLEALTQEAQQRWGDCLSLDEPLLDPFLADSWNEPVTIAEDANDDVIEDQQVGLLLSSLNAIGDGLGALTNDDTQTNEPSPPATTNHADGGVRQPAYTPPDTNSDDDTPSSVFGSSPSASISFEDLGGQAPIDPELREAYMDDAQQGLSAIESCLLTYEQSPNDKRPLNQVCRELHTLKGASASIGLDKLARFLHQVEDQLQDSSETTEGPIDLQPIFQAVDAVRMQVGETNNDNAEADPSTGAANGRSVDVPAERFVDTSNSQDSVRVKSAQLDRLMDMLAELVMLRNRRESRVERLKDVHNELVRCVSRLRAYEENHSTATLLRGCETQDAGPSAASQRRQSPVSSLTEIANDLLLMGGGLRELYEPVGDENMAISGFIRQFRQELIQLRRVPVRGLFQRLQRSARDAARTESKQVRLQLVGEEVGLETSLQQQLYEPLLHIVRNAVSHGIESKSQRSASGKNPVGTVTLEAHGGANLLVITVRDDGKGLDYDALRRRGLEMGLIPTNRAVPKAELARLIFHPGFSTRSETSEVSGRGVGMDVVASALERLHSWVEVDSAAGQGTSIRLMVPLHSVIEHVMVFRAGGQEFAVPTQSVSFAGNSQENTDKTNYPVKHLSQLFGFPSANLTDPQLMVLTRGDGERNSLGERSEQRVGLLVDEIVGPEEVVVRPLPDLMAAHRLFSGVTLSGVGDVMLMFDSQQLLNAAFADVADDDVLDVGDAVASITDATPARRRVLVVDDSRTSRRTLTRCLAALPFDIDEAVDGLDALKRIRDQSYDAIFTDLEMPEMGGMDLLREVRRSPRTANIPVVIVSSRGETVFKNQAKQFGVSDYLVKPVNETVVNQTLERLALNASERISR